jgi:F0F1-type ATP synthase assembly protein I
VSSGDDRQQVVRNLALAGMVSQIGCVTVVIVIGALLAGLWVDKMMDTRPLFTILFLLGSIPVSLFLLVRIAFSTAAHLAPPPPQESENQSSNQE